MVPNRMPLHSSIYLFWKVSVFSIFFPILRFGFYVWNVIYAILELYSTYLKKIPGRHTLYAFTWSSVSAFGPSEEKSEIWFSNYVIFLFL